MAVDSRSRGTATGAPAPNGDRPTEGAPRSGPVASCAHCHYLSAISGEVLPDPQRAELISGSPDSFTWLSCAKAVEHFSPGDTEVIDAVVKRRECNGYRPYDTRLTTEQMLQRELREPPMRLRVAITVAMLMLVGAAIAATIEFAT